MKKLLILLGITCLALNVSSCEKDGFDAADGIKFTTDSVTSTSIICTVHCGDEVHVNTGIFTEEEFALIENEEEFIDSYLHGGAIFWDKYQDFMYNMSGICRLGTHQIEFQALTPSTKYIIIGFVEGSTKFIRHHVTTKAEN